MDFLKEKLNQREAEGNLRKLSSNPGRIDFFSNDYLGLSRNRELAEAIDKEYRSLNNIFNGSTGSRLLSGNAAFTEEVEKELSVIFKAQNTLIFNSGYNANLSILSSIPQKGDTIIYDELIHASLKEGARLSFADRFSFRHNELSDLEQKLKRAKGKKFVVVESVYSMDGDSTPLPELIEVCEKQDAFVILDEAHSTGIKGFNGNGLACSLGLEERIFARIYTFGKGMGIHGACIAGNKILIEYLVNFARAFIYTTALPPHSICAIKVAFSYLATHKNLVNELDHKIKYFERVKQELKIAERFISGDSPIKAFKVGGNLNTRALAEFLQNKNFEVRPILSPTVKTGEERLRICLHNFNSNEDIKNLLCLIQEFSDQQV